MRREKEKRCFVGEEEQRICVNSREEMFRKALKSHNSQEDGYCWDHEREGGIKMATTTLKSIKTYKLTRKFMMCKKFKFTF
jgi:hypothetical protein